MPAVSEEQRKAMYAAAAGHSTLGIPKKVGEEFVGKASDDGLAPNGGLPIGYRKKITGDAETPRNAAGIVFVAPDGDILLLRRSNQEANYAGHWALPGGGVEEGETPEQGARRESVEEIGHDAAGTMKPLDRRPTPNGMTFHTFAHVTPEKFTPTLNPEHSGFAWASLDMLPRPLHPAVEQTLKDQVGLADDMAPEDWEGLRVGFLRWTQEEEAEPEHATDSAKLIRPLMAIDKDSVRTFDRDGRLKVARTHISKANVCPYRGSEIPGYDELGLDPDKIYNLLRDPDELKKAAATLNGVPLLRKHVPVNAEDHQPDEVVGSLGSHADFDGEYLDNSIYVNAKEAIDGIESGKKRELSAGYHYKPDMTPGNFRGTAFDGVMRDIVFNHVALVEDGRAGPDVVVGDSMENVIMKPTRFAAMSLALAAGSIAPLLAMDSKVVLPKDLFTKLTAKTFKDHRTALLAGVRSAIDGKLRSGIALDATMKDFANAIDAFSDDVTKGMDEPVSEEVAKKFDDRAAIEPVAAPLDDDTSFDAEPMKAFCREKGMSEDDISALTGMLPKKAAMDSEESDEDKKKREDEEAKKKAAEDSAKAAKDAEMKDMVTKPAMDAALKAHGDAVAKQVRDSERGIRNALEQVKPWVGALPASLAFDSAADVHRHALTMLGVSNAKTLHADALLPVLEAQRKPGERAVTDEPIAMDSSRTSKFEERYPGAANIRAA